MSQNNYHIPALYTETITGLVVNPSGVYADVTMGGAGHTRGILGLLSDEGRLFGFDQDEAALCNAPQDSRFTMVHSNFCHLKNFLRYYGVTQVDGVVADLGLSFRHVDDESRGFSFRFDAPLDMRMSRGRKLTAAGILAEYTPEQISNLFTIYGEIPRHTSKRIASEIERARKVRPIEMTGEFLELLKPFIDPRKERKMLAQIFQSLRIETNQEMQVLRRLLTQALQVLKPGGRLVIISYHSLEDRLVKNFLKTGNFEGEVQKDFFGRNLSPFKLITNKPIVPSDEEIERNPRSRSAKLRIAEKI
ncbi:MAG: 16S rRNA (cytosine(1402)-N(4))-methyltransferase RsmH [Muribaculaceae bacterium]|nr:16S rRNA (cytosine(1402)-N(4))-methyltransferase RsmH [Muribaculaceae bacterium]